MANSYKLTREMLLNDFAYRCFRDIADQDYIAARLAYHHDLPEPSLWQSQQAIEKYLKCILLLHRIPATKIFHNLTEALALTQQITNPAISLTPATNNLISHIDMYGTDRYLTNSSVSFGQNVIKLDRAVWELRRFCTLNPQPRQLELRQGKPATRYAIEGGWLENLLTRRDATRKAFLRENGFWGSRRRTSVKTPSWISISNAPLWLHPEILPLVKKYVTIPKDIAAAYENHTTPGHFVPEDGLEVQFQFEENLLNASE